MKKLFVIFAVVFITKSFAQTPHYPYLNASTGNKGQFIVDKDTNIFVYQNDMIEKLDKNYNSIWKKSYSGLNFHSLLLSTTGSMYFISASTYSYGANTLTYNKIGKIEHNGSLTWCKSIDSTTNSVLNNTVTLIRNNANQLFLDRTNHLVVTGVAENSNCGFLLKFDTIGLITKYKTIRFLGINIFQLNIINDSAGVFLLASQEYYFENGGYNIYKYSDLADTIIGVASGQEVTANHSQISRGGIFKSKYNPNDIYFIHNYEVTPGSSPLLYEYRVFKESKNGNSFSVTTPMNYINIDEVESVDEDNDKNLIINMSYGGSLNGGFNYFKYTYIIDSIGSANSKVLYGALVNNNYNYYYPSYLKTSLNPVYKNKYFYYVASHGSNNFQNILIKNLDTSLVSACSSKSSILFTSYQGSSMSNFSNVNNNSGQTTYTVSTQMVNVINIPSTNILNNCLFLNTSEIFAGEQIFISPNPANDVLNIEFSTSRELTEQSITIEITNTLGQLVLQEKMINPLSSFNIQHLQSGVYYLEFKTTDSIIRKKFIKQ